MKIVLYISNSSKKKVNNLNLGVGCPRCVMVKSLDGRIVVSEFKLQSRYYVHFQTNTTGKGMNPLSFQVWVK